MAMARGVAPAPFWTVVNFLALTLSKIALASFPSPFQAACGIPKTVKLCTYVYMGISPNITCIMFMIHGH